MKFAPVADDAARPLVDASPAGPYGNGFGETTPGSDEASRPMVRKKLGRGRKNRCRFCTKEGCPRPAFVDYKDVQTLKKLCTSQGKLFSRKRSGNCAAFQRAVKDAVKRAALHGPAALRRRVTEPARSASKGLDGIPRSRLGLVGTLLTSPSCPAA